VSSLGRVRSRALGRGVAVLAVAAIALAALTAPHDATARGRTFVPNCGGVEFLEVEPTYWSYGCTSGSPLVKPLRWVRYGNRRAVARGKAIVQDCGCSDPTAVRRYPARLVLSAPRHCPNQDSWSYFSKARLTITYPSGNPFGVPAGAHHDTFTAQPGSCEKAL
jgi:hypothetical protein